MATGQEGCAASSITFGYYFRIKKVIQIQKGKVVRNMQFEYRQKKVENVRELAVWEGKQQADGFSVREFFNREGFKMQGDCQIDVDAWAQSFLEGSAVAATRLMVEALMQGAYRFARSGLLKCADGNVFEHREELIRFAEGTVYLVSETNLEESIQKAELLGTCQSYARMLGDLPANYLTTDDFCRYAEALSKSLAETAPVGIRIFRDAELKEMGCGGILAVNQASGREAALLQLSYHQNGEGKKTALVGKGILFDSGGYHLKDIGGMEGMKYDMCGAADVLCLFEYAVRSGAALPLQAVIPLAENLMHWDGVRMGDVIGTMCGKTVEVYNTDAEGRLLLCDALTFASRENDVVIDMATLTYSCQNALGDETVGFFSNDACLTKSVRQAAEISGEPVWQLPYRGYRNYITWSKTADIANYAPGRGAGASVAAVFLAEFVEPDTAWVHFDMVGPAVNRKGGERMEKGATGTLFGTVSGLLK